MPEVIRLEPCLGSGHAAFAQTALTNDTNCLVLFDASWRQPAKRVEKQAASVADRYAVALLSIDVDDCPELARRYQVAGVPSLLFLREGQMVARRIGELSEHDLEDWIESLLGGD
jgi:thioredoxin-like negative regulator of GroEL